MFKPILCAAALAISPLAASADPAFYDDRATLERDREALLGLQLNLTFGAQDPEMKLKFGTHYKQDGEYAFVPVLSFTSQDHLGQLRLDGLAAEGEAGAAGGDNTALWLIGGGVLLAAAVASGGGDSDEEWCPTGGLALLDLLECLDED